MGAAYFYYNKSRLGTSREDLVSFARFQNDPASGNVEIGIEPLGGGSGGGGRVMEETAASVHLEVPQQKTSSSPSSVTDAYAEEPVIPVFPEPTGSRGDERPLVTSSSSSPSWIKRKLTRTFVNPLFGDPSARVSWRIRFLPRNCGNLKFVPPEHSTDYQGAGPCHPF